MNSRSIFGSLAVYNIIPAVPADVLRDIQNNGCIKFHKCISYSSKYHSLSVYFSKELQLRCLAESLLNPYASTFNPWNFQFQIAIAWRPF